MGTFLKYAFYLILILVVYLVGKGIYEGSINDTTTIGEVASEVKDGMKNLANEADSTIKKNLDNYEKEPKKDVELD